MHFASLQLAISYYRCPVPRFIDTMFGSANEENATLEIYDASNKNALTKSHSI